MTSVWFEKLIDGRSIRIACEFTEESTRRHVIQGPIGNLTIVDNTTPIIDIIEAIDLGTGHDLDRAWLEDHRVKIFRAARYAVKNGSGAQLPSDDQWVLPRLPSR